MFSRLNLHQPTCSTRLNYFKLALIVTVPVLLLLLSLSLVMVMVMVELLRRNLLMTMLCSGDCNVFASVAILLM